MTAGQYRGCHHPRKQYAAAFMLDDWRHGVLGRPVKPGDDGCARDGAS
jgi:hypothetical protein